VLIRLSKLFIVAALACSIGLHWALLQSVAWVGMVVSYSQNTPLGEALAKTFDGKHPCALCKKIAQGQNSEKKSEFQIQVKKLEFLDAKTQFVFAAPDYFRLLPAWTAYFASLARTPPVPPPRELLG
jgi:hypothetical protein